MKNHPPLSAGHWRLVARYLLLILGIALVVFVLLTVLRVGVFYSLYTWIFGTVHEVMAFGLWTCRALALGLLTLLWYFAGHLLVLPWIGDKKKRVAILMVAAVLPWRPWNL